MKQILHVTAAMLLTTLYCVSWVFAAGTDPGIKIHPIHHASMVIESNGITIYIDPVGDLSSYAPFPRPDYILVTHTHKDHLNREIVAALKQARTLVVSTREGVAELGGGRILNNGDILTLEKIKIEAVPAYNLTPDRQKFHPKGRDNGYVITLSGKRLYISGDTEDIPEMRRLKHIDYAFVCMNLPYTMTEAQAASAVMAFKPKVVFPYHYRGITGLSNLEKFKQLITDPHIQVKFLDWY